LSLQTTIFPDDWKLAKITPVLKDGNKHDCGNYRPISVISVVAKILEKLVYQQLKSFMTINPCRAAVWLPGSTFYGNYSA
jgi:hypothetical protein